MGSDGSLRAAERTDRKGGEGMTFVDFILEFLDKLDRRQADGEP